MSLRFESLEKWRPVRGFEGLYAISNHGRVRSLKRRERITRFKFGKYDKHERIRGGRIVAQKIDSRGYLALCLWKNGKPHHRSIHRLLLEAFVGLCPKSKHGCRHLDGNKLNNSLINLKWGTRQENIDDSIKHGTWTHGEKSGNAKLTDRLVKQIKRSSGTQREIAKRFNVSQGTIWQITHGNSWKHVDA